MILAVNTSLAVNVSEETNAFDTVRAGKGLFNGEDTGASVI